MSYELKGKQIWGSAIYRIHCDLESKRIEQEFKGELTLFERRHESKKVKFSDLDQFVAALRDMWSVSLRVDTVQDARLARWIEEYLPELGITVSYEEILEILRGEYVEAPPIEVLDEIILTQEDIDKIVPQASDRTITGITMTLKGAINDESAMERILDGFLQQYKPKRSVSMETKFSFFVNEKEINKSESFNFVNSPVKDEISLVTEFTNTYGHALENVSIVDFIPNDFQVLDVHKPNELVKEKVEEKHEGDFYYWILSTIAPKETIKIEYTLTQKMLRTILVRDDNDLNILQLQDDINIEGRDIWVDSSYTFQDKTPVIENVKVVDQIPKNYKIIRSSPDITEPRAKIIDTPQGSQVLWSFSNVPAATQMKIEYELEYIPRLFREVISLIGKKDEHDGEIVKIIKPFEKSDGYGVIYGFKSASRLDYDLEITDIYPKNLNLSLVNTEFGEIEITENGMDNKIIWKIENPPQGEEVFCYLKIEGDKSIELDLKQFKVSSRKKELIEEKQSEEIIKKEGIVMPETYQSEVEN